MTTTEWIIFVVGCFFLACALLLIRSSRMISQSAWFFSLSTGTGLALSYAQIISAYHLLWIAPVAFVISALIFLWRATAMMENGIKQLNRNPHLKRTVLKSLRESSSEKTEPEEEPEP